jgi:Lamin Tail Domain/Fn3 associated/CotH kinase protein/PA14 domain/Divergent InlB B-repeat domain
MLSCFTDALRISTLAALLATAPTSGFALVISEAVAAPQATLADADGDHPDWIELHNPSAAAVSLLGWTLSDDATNTAKWAFPAITLPAGGHLLVYCSDKGRSVAGQELHTNFNLSDDGETLILRRPNGQADATMTFGGQHPGIAFDGIDYVTPTPGASNTGAAVLITRTPRFSKPASFCSAAFNLTITSTPGATIHYTTDGTVPSPLSPIYTKPLRIGKTTALRVVALAEGKAPSASITQTYLFVADMVKQSPTGAAPAGWPTSWGNNRVDYGMDPRIAATGKFAKLLPGALKALPTIALTLPTSDLFDATTGIYANAENKGVGWERASSVELIYPDGRPGFQINAGLRIRGGASRSSGNAKHSFRVLMRKDYGPAALNFPLFGAQGAPRTERFDLRCEQLVAWHYFFDPEADFIRDIYARSTHGVFGQPHTRSNFYHLVINGQYWGMYQTEERIGAEYAKAYFGGSEKDYDVLKLDYDWDDTQEPSGTKAIDGSIGAWRRAVDLGSAGLADMGRYYQIQGMNPDGSRNPAYEPLIDVDNLIDYMLAGIYNAVDDSPPSGGTQNNWSAIRSRKGDFGFRFFAHDWEISMYEGDTDRVGEQPIDNPFIYSWSPDPLPPQEINGWHFWQAMRFNSEFRLRVADRVQKHFFNDGPVTQENAVARWRGFMDTIDRAVIGESARWGDAREAPGGRPSPMTRDHWLKACNNHILGNFLANRTANVLNHLRNGNLAAPIPAPSMTPHGGVIQPTATIPMIAPLVLDPVSGDTILASIYYTTNGSDPRLVGGAISSKATLYTSPLRLAKKTTVKARSYSSGRWSALTEATFEPSGELAALRITELHYNPPATAGGDDAEFIELQNTGLTALTISGFSFQTGIDYTFPADTTLAPGAFIVVARNPTAFAAVHGFTPAGPYTGKLDNDGESLTLVTSSGARLFKLDFDDEDSWPSAPDGYGHSLVYRGAGDSDQGRNWFSSATLGGSPNLSELAQSTPLPVIISEVTNSGGALSIELLNLTTSDVSISGWKIVQGASQITLAAGLTVPANARLVLGAADLGGLAIADVGGILAIQRTTLVPSLRDEVHRFRHGPMTTEVSYARRVTSDGREWFPQQAQPTLGAAETTLLQRSIHLSELHYSPTPPATGESPHIAFIELKNTSAGSLDISGYRLAGVTYSFPVGSVIPAGELALIVAGDPALFRTRYAVPAAVPIFGPFIGSFDTNGERIALEAAVITTAGPAFAVIEELRYTLSAPWPVLASGLGHSAQRLSLVDYAAEPQSWAAATPSPGMANTANSAPAVTLTQLPSAPGDLVTSFEVHATDRDGSITEVQLIKDGTVIATAAAAPSTFPVTASPGVHDVWARVIDDQGASTLSSSFTIGRSSIDSILAQGAGLGLLAEYYSTTDLSGTAAHSEIVPSIGGDWFHSDPPGVSRAAFSVRYSGSIKVQEAGLWGLTLRSAGGSRVYANGNLIGEDWSDKHGGVVTINSGQIEVSAGELVAIVIEYFDDDGHGYLEVSLANPPRALSTDLLYHQQQDPADPQIGLPTGMDSRLVGQRFAFQFQVFNSPVDEALIAWSTSDALPAGVSLTATGHLSGLSRTAGRYPITLRATFPDTTSIERPMTLVFQDRSPAFPVIQITEPKPVLKTARNVPITARGKAYSLNGIVAIHYSLNGGVRHRLPAGADWSLALIHDMDNLLGGPNTITAQAEDSQGLLSAPVSKPFNRQYRSPLIVTVNGAGSVTKGFLGYTMRTTGKTYTVTATPSKNFNFMNWAGVYSESKTLRFIMQDSLVLTANFELSPFLSSVGPNIGLLEPDVAVLDPGHALAPSHALAGRVQLNLNVTGSFTGSLRYRATNLPFKGHFGQTGNELVTISDPKRDFQIDLFLYYDRGTNRIRVSTYSAFTPLAVTLQPIAVTKPSPLAGTWNLLIPPTRPDWLGHGYMTCQVSPTGKFVMKATLPTGKVVTESSYVTRDGGLTIYGIIPPPRGVARRESLAGVLKPVTTASNTRLEGHIDWTSDLGFLPEFGHEVTVQGSRWLPRSATIPFLPIDSTFLTVTHPLISDPMTGRGTLINGAALQVPLTNGSRVLLVPNPKTGRIMAAVTLPAGNGLPVRTVIVQGLADQGRSAIGGYFVDRDGTIGDLQAWPPIR